MDKHTALKQYFGHDEFRLGQEELVDALLSRQDVLGIMPTGAGKSICYQLPALLLPGVTLVISPLISLMKDQVAALAQIGLSAAFINSTLSQDQCQEIFHRARHGIYKLIYVAPERLSAPSFLHLAQELEIPLVAIDEAHCVSQWGQDFRPSYLKITEFVENFPQRPTVGAFTATATEQVKEDIKRLLALQNPLCITTGFDRPNLYFETIRPKSKDAYLKKFISEHPGQSGIVYCSTRKTVESVCAVLAESGFPATRYHAGLPEDERRQNQEDFVYDRVQIMVATNAFGMGIDKSNVGFVIHYNMPKDVESYYQEAGRSGRDGAYAHCALLFSENDVRMMKFLINAVSDHEELSKEEQKSLQQRDLQRLEKMTSYCKTTGCLRAYLLRYFGESAPDYCGKCSNCTGKLEQRDITLEAQKILSAVTRVERQYRSGLGTALIIRMLRGSRDQRVLQLGLDKLSTYGIMADVDRMQIRAYIDCLLEQGYLCAEGIDYPVLHTTQRAKGVLFRSERVTCIVKNQDTPERISEGKSAVTADASLLERLRAVRTKLASEGGVPAYVVFSNASLEDMTGRKPATMEEFMKVAGVGEIKAKRYGEIFLKTIKDWRQGERGKETEYPHEGMGI